MPTSAAMSAMPASSMVEKKSASNLGAFGEDIFCAESGAKEPHFDRVVY